MGEMGGEMVADDGGEGANFLASLLEGEQVLSWQRHGVALTTCELENFPLWGNFLTEARSLPRETVSAKQTEGVFARGRELPLSEARLRK